MTLITYLTRVHFADGVLEEAIWSEFEAANKRRPMVLFDRKNLPQDQTERFLSSVPGRVEFVEFSDIPNVPDERSARSAATLYNAKNCDVLMAFGTARTIDLAKATRVAIKHDEPLTKFAYSRGGSKRIGTDLPDLFAAPDISGCGSAVSAHAPIIMANGERALLMCKKLIPTVTVCDPTLTLAADQMSSASAGADAITQCVEAYLSKSYNPPAEGIALDGLRRAVTNVGTVLNNGNDIFARREMMAASLNGALAVQKGLGASQAISNALEAVCEFAIRPGVLNRIVLPSVLRFNRTKIEAKFDPIRTVFALDTQADVPNEVQAFLEKLPLPRRFSELGVERSHLEAAAPVAAFDLATGTNPRALGQ
ncbi:MAG: iron-containing alcohol dehydrogenase, partial [Pseudomonadota bacterium]